MIETLFCDKCGSLLNSKDYGFTKFCYCKKCYSHYQFYYISTCCDNPKIELVKSYQSNGRLQVQSQCLNCGIIDSHIVKFNDGSIDINRLKQKNKEKHDQECKRRNDLKSNLVNWLRGKCTEMFFQNLNIYYTSVSWRQKRELVLIRDNFNCQGCLQSKATEVHHLSYEHLYNELLFELISLCHSCHEKITIRDKNQYLPNIICTGF